MRWLALAISVLFVLAAAAIADPDVPLEIANAPAPAEAAKQPTPSVAGKPKAKLSAADIRKLGDTQFKQCIRDWDAATHMTKREWERTCRRVVDDRAKFMVDEARK